MASGGEDKVIGACFRFYRPVSGEEDVMRELRFPRSLPEKTYPWKEPKTKRR
jgi:hypothetical protein